MTKMLISQSHLLVDLIKYEQKRDIFQVKIIIKYMTAKEVYQWLLKQATPGNSNALFKWCQGTMSRAQYCPCLPIVRFIWALTFMSLYLYGTIIQRAVQIKGQHSQWWCYFLRAWKHTRNCPLAETSSNKKGDPSQPP